MCTPFWEPLHCLHGFGSRQAHCHHIDHDVGPFRYFDPEYFTTQKLTTASDVYSFGVVLLELLTGQKVIDHVSRGEEYNLIKWVNDQCSPESIHWEKKHEFHANLIICEKVAYPSIVYISLNTLTSVLQVEVRVKEGGVDLIVDTKLEGNYPRQIFLQMTTLALHCCASEKKERPTMKVLRF